MKVTGSRTVGVAVKIRCIVVRVRIIVLLVEVDVVVVVEVVVVLVVQSRPEEPANIPSLSAVEVSHAPQRDCAKDDAPTNISSILVTLDTSHLDTSPLNDNAE